VRTTLEIPDPLLRRAKDRAKKRGIPLRQFVAEAVEAKLREPEPPKPAAEGKLPEWFGRFRDPKYKEDSDRINQIIEEEFEQIEPEEWT
jgi:hypothetical protein